MTLLWMRAAGATPLPSASIAFTNDLRPRSAGAGTFPLVPHVSVVAQKNDGLCYRAPMRTPDLSRRSFLAIAAALPFAAAAALKGAKNVPVGLELYSVRGELAKDLLGTVAAVGKMGYQVVEFYAPYLEWTPETAKSVRKVMDDTGLKCRSTHNNGPSFTPDGLKKAIDLNQIIGSTNIVMASSAVRITGLDSWKTVA